MQKKDLETVLFIGLVFPEPTSSAAGTRILQLISLYKDLGYKVIFASTAQKTENSFDLSSIDVVEYAIELNHASFDDFVLKIDPVMVVFDRFISEEQFGWRVATTCPKAIRILDSEDLHCLRYARHTAVKKNMVFEIKNLVEEPLALREIASIYRSDLTLIISEFEIEVLQNVFKIDKTLLYYLPIFYSNKVQTRAYEDRKNFVFIGNFLHEPNYDAVLQLKMIWKDIRKELPNINLNVYGAYVSPKINQLNNEKEGFCIRGRASCVYDVLEESKVLLAPLRFGAGIKGKLLEAMVVNTPSITTSIGVEGISSIGYWNGYVADNMKDFIEKSITLYREKEIWEESCKKGEKIILEKFKKELYKSLFKEFILKLKKGINSHRNQNFIGKLLSQNQFASTKYMSKWIEEKSKK
ncbi:glycosyltransferase [Flavobacterium columnare]|uniref:Glycosyl transferase, group 1 family protein n=1 Tax=Flavobacterium columnare (strain ATCC 49512 / CIP 103533 / TG 44/87) TaxID=1041826 RepID=G8X5D1_FLACA|nr:glycosyl transferase, group 1 family protein [Flavobacterium columnare ATCC 49512]PDS27184.1 glycosyltransferase [Flavobacterium columnare] [Flavobacterium columnare NBRC 100251 = ATCC 23463]GEM57198.1 glycosyl transferase [Flavobacterium columnare NBRC 100251 = ATCC 23463]